MHHSLLSSVEQEVLETFPLGKGLTVIGASRFDAGGEIVFVFNIVLGIAEVKDFEEAVVRVDFDVVDSFWQLHDGL